MKSNFTKRLCQYSSLAGMILVGKTSHSQIIYHDIDPDFVGLGDTMCELDLNNDGLIDIRFDQQLIHNQLQDSQTCSTFNVIKSNLNLFAYGSNNGAVKGMFDLAPLDAGDTILASNDWTPNAFMRENYFYYLHFLTCGGSSDLTSFHNYTGLWSNMIDKYVGVKFNENGGDHFGWIRMSVDSVEFVIKDYAYNANPGSPIVAGDLVFTSDFSSDQTDVHIFLAGKTLQCSLPVHSSITYEARVIDVMGHIVKQFVIPPYSTTIDLSYLPSGVYFLGIELSGHYQIIKFALP